MATELSVVYGYKTKPSALLNSIFASTVNTAAKTLVEVSSSTVAKWRVRDHLRYIHMLMTWLTVWVLRILMDYFPSIGPSHGSPYLLEGLSAFGSLDLATSSSTSGSLDLVPYDGSEMLPVKALGRALSHVSFFSLLYLDISFPRKDPKLLVTFTIFKKSNLQK